MFARKLDEILQGLEPLVDQGKVAGFLLNVENSGKLAGLAEDVHDAMMEYQVGTYTQLIPPTSEACTLYQTSLQQDIYNKGCLLIVSLTPGPHFHELTNGVGINRPCASQRNVPLSRCWISL